MAVNAQKLKALRTDLSDPTAIAERSFDMLKTVYDIFNTREEPLLAQELILRALEHREAFGRFKPLLDALTREVGLFPYLDRAELGPADELARELHRAPGLREIVFHHPQARVFHALMAGRSVVLSAPTSFGKSLIIDAIVAERRFKNIFLVVPTLALIDETRRRLSRFRDHYKIVTHGTQTPGERNIFVLTQERLLQNQHIENVDFFIIDEFYKLSPGAGDEERCTLLNVAFYRLLKHCRHFYLLGPNVRGLTDYLHESLSFDFIHENYHTVVSELHRVKATKNPLAKLKNLADQLEGASLVFCRSPARTKAVAECLPAGDRGDELTGAAEWIARHYHSDWHLVGALRRGIGIHHGRLPRALAQFVVRAFNDGKLNFLVCTSTLIEGVNTKAKNIIVYDHKINRTPLDLFTFNNICGRSGRMRQHYVGRVYIFADAPTGELPLVDFPAVSPGEQTSAQLLLQLDQDELGRGARDRMEPFVNQDVLPFAVLKKNVGVDPEQQLSFARALREQPAEFAKHLAWSGTPRWPQLQFLGDVIWKHFGGARLAASSVRSPNQLATLCRQLSRRDDTRDLIANQVEFFKGNVDRAVESVLDFQRTWATFHLPRLLRAICEIQRVVLSELGHEWGDYESYATRLESLFLDPAVVALEEYGIPLPLSRKLLELGFLKPDSSLDETLERLKGIPWSTVEALDSFERSLLVDAAQYV